MRQKVPCGPGVVAFVKDDLAAPAYGGLEFFRVFEGQEFVLRHHQIGERQIFRQAGKDAGGEFPVYLFKGGGDFDGVVERDAVGDRGRGDEGGLPEAGDAVRRVIPDALRAGVEEETAQVFRQCGGFGQGPEGGERAETVADDVERFV